MRKRIKLGIKATSMLNNMQAIIREKGLEILNELPIMCSNCHSILNGNWLRYSLIVKGGVKTFQCPKCKLIQTNPITIDPLRPLTDEGVIAMALLLLEQYGRIEIGTKDKLQVTV